MHSLHSIYTYWDSSYIYLIYIYKGYMNNRNYIK
jgi:hypothetical protein